MSSSSKPDWEATRYLNFASERTRPASELLARVPLANPSRIVDLGCGPGNSTSLIATRYPDAQLLGNDTSESMLEQARKALPGVEFEIGDVTTYEPEGQVDLFFSNAVFQWVNEEDRIPSILRLLSFQPEGGVFAFQVPDNFNEPSHIAMREIASSGPFSPIFGKDVMGNRQFHSPFELYNALKPHVKEVDVWHTVYNHRLEGSEAVVDWLRSTGLRPFLEKLDEKGKEKFLEVYTEKMAEAYPRLVDGGVLLRFPRLFCVVTK